MCNRTGGCRPRKKARTDSPRPPKDFICIATGPSLTKEDCEKAKGSSSEIIVINDNYRIVEDADYLYACDLHWWKMHIDAIKSTFKGQLYCQWHRDDEKAFAKERGITAIPGVHARGLGREKLHFNNNSGAQAINLAYLLGARRIILLGYDMGATGNSHWFGSHPKGLSNGNYSNYVTAFDRLAEDLKYEGVEVINCTRKTALTQFKRGVIDDYTDQIGGCDL